MEPISENVKRRPILGWFLFFATIVVVFALGMLW